jgi:predicted LPLAT superfamily acyltransferase
MNARAQKGPLPPPEAPGAIAGPDSGAPPSAGWVRAPERGSVALYRFMVWFSLRLGRAPARGLLRLIAAYFLAFGGAARQCSRDYLTRCLGRAPTLAEQYRLFFSFASTVHDRVFFLKDRFDLFEIEVHGAELFDDQGGFLMGAHMGSFEALRAAARLGRRQVAMAMYGANARKISAVLAAINPALENDIVGLGRLGSMLELRERLESGALIGILADRTLGDEAVIDIDFLGSPAPFPTGPMRMAAALRQRVAFMTALYRGGNRYEIRFEPLADFSGAELARGERERAVREAIERYARRLEHYCRAAPDNWFNFHRFWRP